MLNYKGTYIVKFERDKDGKIYNRFDNFIACRSNGKIYRHSKDVLVFESTKKIRLIKKDEDGNVIKDCEPFVLEIRDTDAEREIFFKEENIKELEELFKIRKPKQLTEEQREQREQARLRMFEFHKNKGNESDDIEEDFDDSLDEENLVDDTEVDE